MDKKNLADFTNEELLKEVKAIKSYKIYDAFIIGFLAGVAIYSVVKNGFGLFTFLPLVYLPIAKKNKERYAEIERLAQERGLK